MQQCLWRPLAAITRALLFRASRKTNRRPRYSERALAFRRDRRASRFATINNRIDRPIINVAAAVIAGLNCSRRPANI